ncbi:hypothetical protein HW115_08970 [Verrucomicrobiaceae bacterium N1E253]|uniref:FecR protein domain-containing protein n=1 Tax=Oceaniferula marina TaxID=2748318 RepID=A0A851GLT5_9BACT|nr:LamG-like jellyroll fold domain-containing protein [Oceaniferula marina]NWK55740.1 hypothetical protein [Oceaniferula marina]
MIQTLESRIQTMLDGTISEEEFRHLEDELIANPEARQIYYSYISLHQGLEFRLSRSSSTSSASGTHAIQGLAESRLKRQRARARKLAVISAAALILISLVSMRFFLIQEQASSNPLDFKTSPGTLFTLTHSSPEAAEQGFILEKESRLQISQGSVELNFPSGVRAIVQAPADLTLHNDNQLYLGTGTGWFHVPEQARGFTVITREMKIIDLGTKFGVVSTPQTDDEIHVFKGMVEAIALHGVKKKTTLTAGQAALVRPYGRFHTIEPNTSAFPTELPRTLPHLHFSFDQRDVNPLPTSANQLKQQPDVQAVVHTAANPSSTPEHSSGKFGQALKLDGVSNYLETNWDGILGNQPRSVAFWIKMPEMRLGDSLSNGRTIIGWGMQQERQDSVNVNSKWTIHLDPATNRYPMLNISFGGFWYYAPETVLDDDQWHHLTVVYTGEADDKGQPITQLYLDGQRRPISKAAHNPVQRDVEDNIAINTTAHTPLVVGAALHPDARKLIHHNRFLKAEIDELYIIEGAITEESVLKLMHQNQLSH